MSLTTVQGPLVLVPRGSPSLTLTSCSRWKGTDQNVSLPVNRGCGRVLRCGVRRDTRFWTPRGGVNLRSVFRVELLTPTTRVWDPPTLIRTPKQETGEPPFVTDMVRQLDERPTTVLWVCLITSDTTHVREHPRLSVERNTTRSLFPPVRPFNTELRRPFRPKERGSVLSPPRCG